MFRSCLIAALALPMAAVVAAPTPRPAAKRTAAAKKDCCARCPMCAAMKSAKSAAGPARGMGGMMGGKAAAPGTAVTVTFAPDGTVYAVRGDTIYKLDANLAVAGQVRLGVPPAAGVGEHAGHKH
ncbi:MAG: hypothetical protein K0Q72_3201 [Armatimonadetes bacterium]|jgi:hypothetical protein|nr:hypothetical protein [Armatimonadota bacterium]